MKYNILIVDDEIYTIEDIRACIDQEALNIGEIYTAVNTNSAMRILGQEPVHIIISDIDMPGGDGISFLRSVRDTHADTPCIFVTNYADFSYAQQAIHLKVLDYLLKPIEMDVLNEALSRAISLVNENAEPAAEALKHPNSKNKEGMTTFIHSDKYISNAMEYIQNNLLNDVTRESVSEYVHISPDHLDRLFREQVGMSAFRYIVARKIEYAKELLLKTDFPVCAIATDLGYCNLSNFSLAFRKIVGVTPAEYRKALSRQ